MGSRTIAERVQMLTEQQADRELKGSKSRAGTPFTPEGRRRFDRIEWGNGKFIFADKNLPLEEAIEEALSRVTPRQGEVIIRLGGE